MSRHSPTHQIAALPLRRSRTGLQVRLITSRRSGRWQLPKGNRMWGVPDFVAAGIEAMQEAGVVGWLTRKPVGLYRDTKGRPEGRKVVVYRLDAGVTLPVWPEKRQRKAMWASVAVAIEVVTEPGLRKLLRDCLTSAEGEVSGD